MRIIVFILLTISASANAIDACNEHAYCPPQGTVHVMVSPTIASELQYLCDGASFDVHFSLKDGQPTDVVIESGPEALRTAINQSFHKWRFGFVHEVKDVKESIVLESNCSLRDRGAPWQ